MKSLKLRISITLVIAVLAVVYALPTMVGKDSGLDPVLPDKEIKLGLDLKGGIHLTLGVDIPKAVENALGQAGNDIRLMAREEGVVVLRPSVIGGDTLQFVLLKSEQQQDLQKMLEDAYSHLQIEKLEELGDGRLRYELTMTPRYREHLAKLTVDQAVKTIRNRIDQFGVAEPDIRKQQDNKRIQVQLPGLDDPERAIEIIGKTAHLEFKLVAEDVDVEKAKKGILPPGTELAVMRDRNPDGTYTERPIVLRSDAAMTGETITDAHTSFDNYGQPYVSLNFNAAGARQFARLTGENVGKRLAIVLDGTVYSAPVIRDKITGGRASITGGFTTDEAHDLSIVLRAGALPAPVNVLEERSVGPSLGQQSIEKGVTSAIIGGLAVLVFMVIYYGFAGIVADLVLALNILLIMAGLAAFGATLTLPGIAGIILTIGMAVDANVLIFERIREEVRKGFTPRAAVEEGYARATLTILDANVTTIIAAVILYQFGTGPIRGFAVTLTLGILASMFTAIFVSRILFDLWTRKRGTAKLSV
jgi:preprotein translocase subunit SecD